MEISYMAGTIMSLFKNRYGDSYDDCIDVIHLNKICNIYKRNVTKDQKSTEISSNVTSMTIENIEFSSPNFKNTLGNKKKHSYNILKSEEFTKKYRCFIRIIYACLKMDVEIFDINNNKKEKIIKKSGSKSNKPVKKKQNFLTLKSNYYLLRAILDKKRALISNHIIVLKEQYNNISIFITTAYQEYMMEFYQKIKILDKLAQFIEKIVADQVVDQTDNIFELILPYFYVYQEFIEEYNC